MTVVEILRNAKALIERRGWYQGGLWGADGSVCMVGALDLAGHYSSTYLDTCYKQARLLVGAVINGHTNAKDHMGSWNDAPGRTKQDVLAAFDAAIAIAEAQARETERQPAERRR